MKELLKKFENKAPHIVFEWHDSETEAKGWVVINSLRGGAAGGGTRMRVGLDKHEVTSLAKTMEMKFVWSGPAIGGAKSGIDFDPADPRKAGVLRRWYQAVLPLLKNYYGTGGDLNVDEIKEVIPVTSSMGLFHPQEGVLMGHFQPSDSEKQQKISQLQIGVSLIVTDTTITPDPTGHLVVADLITGWGVSEAVRHFYEKKGESLKGKKVIVQGWGNVAAAAGYYQALEGAKVVGIIDRVGGLINEDGFSLEEIADLFMSRPGNHLKEEGLLSFEEVNARIWDLEADVFLPCAASRLLTKNQLERLKTGGVEVISCGANVPFADQEIFFGPIGEWADGEFAVIPDFIANSGMARTFGYLMQGGIEVTDRAIFDDVSNIISTSLDKINERNSTRRNLCATGFEIALETLM
ncbi:MAG: amino acid dehydrogenase [Bacteroidetes bacterium]|nr:amino acid dehydrogenase [Bacteroidota bacterium]